MELENNEEGNGKGNKKRIAIIAVVVAAFLLLSPHEPEASSIKDAATTTQEQLDEEAMKSRLWVSVANTIYADSATDTCYATDKDGNKITVLDNREENSRDISYTVTLEDGTEIYQSEIIKPGDGIESLDLSSWNTSKVTTMRSMFEGSFRLSVNCSNWDVSKVSDHKYFNSNAPGVILPSAWQTSSDEDVEDSAIAPLGEEQGNRDALRVSDENGNDEATSKTDGKASADSEAEGSTTTSADDVGAKEEEASGDVVQEEPAAA